MVFFAFEDALGDEHGEGGVLDAEFFDARVEPVLRINLVQRGTVLKTGVPWMASQMLNDQGLRI